MADLRWRAFRAVPWVWTAWERFYSRTHPATPVRSGSLFAIRRAGDVLELHLDGHALAAMRKSPGYSTFRAVHVLREDLSALAARVRAGEFAGVTTIRGTSLMGEAGAVLGFEVRSVKKSIRNRLERYFMVGLDAIYHPRGLRERAKARWPVEVAMSVEALLSRYSDDSLDTTT